MFYKAFKSFFNNKCSEYINEMYVPVDSYKKIPSHLFKVKAAFKKIKKIWIVRPTAVEISLENLS